MTRGVMTVAKAELVFEVSWEVCNKVGGIYTVVKSKVEQMLHHYTGGKYFTIGPYFYDRIKGDFSEERPPENLISIFEELKLEGIICHYGRWLVKGKPDTILIDSTGYFNHKDRIKGEFWESFRIDSLMDSYFDFEEPLVWGYCVGKLLEKIAKTEMNKKIVAHFHEWLTGGGLLYIKRNSIKIGTIFTTHATMLGRTLAGINVDIYGKLAEIDATKESYNHHIQTKHLTEVACANNADVFTTVSEITGMEAEHFLGKKPDVLLPNGLDMAKFPTFEELSIKHQLHKSKINEFLLYYFFPYYSFNLQETYLYFIVGRYELHGKGIDLLIDGLAKLNEKLKKDNSEKTIVVFFFIPSNVRGIKGTIIENKTLFNDVKDMIDDSRVEIEHKIINSIISKKKVNQEILFDKEFLSNLKRKVIKFQREGLPPLSTHDLFNEDSDAILKMLKERNLNNSENERVKIVNYPIYLSGADGLLDLDYYESMLGCQLGIFPSYYEPWGYTPLEAGALGIAAVTTDLAGFGRYIQKEGTADHHLPGIFIINRYGKTYEESVDELYKILLEFCHLEKEKRVRNKIQAKTIASKADWKILIDNYIEAHNLAVEKVFG